MGTNKKSEKVKDIQSTIYYKNKKYEITSVTIQHWNIVPKLMRGCKNILKIKIILLSSEVLKYLFLDKKIACIL